MKIIVDKQVWKEIKKHAVRSFPNECVGFYIGFKISVNEIKILSIYPCKNISEDKRVSSMVSKSQMRWITKECKNINKMIDRFFVGQYHSHPTTGSVIQSRTDKTTGRKWKEYRHQLILGIKSKSESGIKKRFYYYKSGSWKCEEIIVKG